MGNTRTVRIWSVGIIVAAAVVATTLVVNSGEDERGSLCMPVEPSLSELVLSRPMEAPLHYAVSVAAEESSPQGRALDYEHYYIIAIQFATPDKVLREGVWGVGTNGPAPEGNPLFVQPPVDGISASITSLNAQAHTFTQWPNGEGFVDTLGETVTRARTCLMDAATASL